MCVHVYSVPLVVSDSLRPYGLYVAHQTPLSMGFFRQECWSGLPCPPPRDLPDPGIEATSLVAPALQAGSLPLSHQQKPQEGSGMCFNYNQNKKIQLDIILWPYSFKILCSLLYKVRPFTFHFHALEKEMATHSSVLAWRIPGTGEPGGLPSLGLHGVGHDWSDLAAAAVRVLLLPLRFNASAPGTLYTG